MTHPLAFTGHRNGFTDRNGRSVKAGDQALYLIDNRVATLDEALHDGDAFVTFGDGSYDTVKWSHLVKAQEVERMKAAIRTRNGESK